jgi:environmental stress-induced protein Ves
MKKISSDQYRSMPWKNGAGTTIEMAVFPDHAGIDDFEWRVSRASVVADGSFSHFAGIDRSLALLDGQGMCLTINAADQQVDAHNNIAVFPGDANIHARLLDGAISDFNLMSRRTICRHQLTHWTGKASRPLPADTVLVYCAKGSGRLVADDGELLLVQDESVQFSSADQSASAILHAAADSRFYCVQIHR